MHNLLTEYTLEYDQILVNWLMLPLLFTIDRNYDS